MSIKTNQIYYLMFFFKDLEDSTEEEDDLIQVSPEIDLSQISDEKDKSNSQKSLKRLVLL